MRAMIHKIADLETEQMMFLVLNKTVNVRAGMIVRAWPGPVAGLLREVAEKPGSPYFAKIHFGQGGSSGSQPYPATLLLRGLLCAATGIGTAGGGVVYQFLARADAAMRDLDAQARAHGMLELIPRVFPPGVGMVLRALPVMALGHVAHDRWKHGVVQPSDAVCGRIADINWQKLAPSYGSQFLVGVRTAIERKWRA